MWKELLLTIFVFQYVDCKPKVYLVETGDVTNNEDIMDQQPEISGGEKSKYETRNLDEIRIQGYKDENKNRKGQDLRDSGMFSYDNISPRIRRLLNMKRRSKSSPLHFTSFNYI